MQFRGVEAIMSQSVSRFKEVIAPNAATLQAADGCYLQSGENTNESIQLVDAKELIAPYGAKRLKDERCPICGHFAC